MIGFIKSEANGTETHYVLKDDACYVAHNLQPGTPFGSVIGAQGYIPVEVIRNNIKHL
ncbi:hypothetical protein D3C80_448450 [compost metagenome]